MHHNFHITFSIKLLTSCLMQSPSSVLLMLFTLHYHSFFLYYLHCIITFFEAQTNMSIIVRFIFMTLLYILIVMIFSYFFIPFIFLSICQFIYNNTSIFLYISFIYLPISSIQSVQCYPVCLSIVLDADALWLVANDFTIVYGYKR